MSGRIEEVKSYEYKDEGGRALCKQHHMLRCSECFYVDEIEQQNKRYREALEFYAKGNHYHAEGYPDTRLIANDYGEVARKELERDNNA